MRKVVVVALASLVLATGCKGKPKLEGKITGYKEGSATVIIVHAKAVKGSKILVLGLAYKPDVDDVRESPALSIIDRLRSKGAHVRYHDPYVAELNFDEAHTDASGAPLHSVELTEEEIRTSDCIVIVTNHSQIDYQRITDLAPLVVDTRNALNGDMRKTSRARIIRL